jgi:ZIP family zinc transporter
MNYSLVLISILLVAASLIGGAVAHKLQNKLNYLLGFVAGLMLGVVVFDLLPEIFELAQEGVNIIYPMIGLALGFIGFHFAEQMTVVHTSHEEGYKSHAHSHVGKLSIYALILHRLLDGLSIGVAFQINAVLGIAVAIAVIAHSFADGLNVISLGKLYKQDKHLGILLAVSSVVPVLGILLASFITLPVAVLVVYLAVFAGFLMYLAAADILPEAHREKPKWSIMALTLLGLGSMLLISLSA